MSEKILFQIHAKDNVGTLLHDVEAGEQVAHRGEGEKVSVRAAKAVKAGHKLAVLPIAAGEPVVKYGVTIGIATTPISVGDWVHLHNCASRFDEKSSRLDVESGERTETRYA